GDNLTGFAGRYSTARERKRPESRRIAQGQRNIGVEILKVWEACSHLIKQALESFRPEHLDLQYVQRPGEQVGAQRSAEAHRGIGAQMLPQLPQARKRPGR